MYITLLEKCQVFAHKLKAIEKLGKKFKAKGLVIYWGLDFVLYEKEVVIKMELIEKQDIVEVIIIRNSLISLMSIPKVNFFRA